MKRMFVIWLGAILLFHGVCFADQMPENFATSSDREGYALGYQFGEGLRRQGFDAGLGPLIQGLRDAVGGKSSLLSSRQMDEAVLSLKKRMTRAQEELHKQLLEENLKKGMAFLEENGKKPGVVTLPSGLQYKVITLGTGRSPKSGDKVRVNYRGSFVDGTEFDSSYRRNEPETIPVGGVMKGWTEALQLMKEGAKWELFIPPDLGYGAQGMGNRIPPNSTLVFEVELLAIN